MADPYFDNVVLLLHCDGADGSTTFTDVKGHTVTASGDAQVDTAQSKWGGASAYFDGGGADCLYLADSTDWDLPGDFTIEGWFRKNNSSAPAGTLIGTYDANGYPSGSWAIQFWAGQLWFNHGARFGATDDLQGSTVYTTDITNWHHFAVTRSGTTIRLFEDGTLTDSGTLSGTLGALTELRLGAMFTGRNADMFTGWLDDIRITKGVARYTTNFTVPSAAFPDAASDTVSHTITASAGACLSLATSLTIDAGSYLSYPASAGSMVLGGGAAIQRRFTPTATLSSALQKQGLTQYALSGAAVQKTQAAPTSADAAIGRILTLWAIAGSAELGVQQFLSLAAGYLLAGREYVPSDALVQQTLEKYASANGYVAVVDLIKTTTVDALFSSFKRAYANSAVQGTATKASNADAALAGTLVKTLSAGFYITGLSSALVVVAQCYLAVAGKLQPGANALLGKVRTKSPRAGAVVGAVYSLPASLGAALTRVAILTVGVNTAVTATQRVTAVPSAAVQFGGRGVQAGLDAVLWVVPASDAVDETTPCEGEWAPDGRPVVWNPHGRGTEWVPEDRAREWVVND